MTLLELNKLLKSKYLPLSIFGFITILSLALFNFHNNMNRAFLSWLENTSQADKSFKYFYILNILRIFLFYLVIFNAIIIGIYYKIENNYYKFFFPINSEFAFKIYLTRLSFYLILGNLISFILILLIWLFVHNYNHKLPFPVSVKFWINFGIIGLFSVLITLTSSIAISNLISNRLKGVLIAIGIQFILLIFKIHPAQIFDNEDLNSISILKIIILPILAFGILFLHLKNYKMINRDAAY